MARPIQTVYVAGRLNNRCISECFGGYFRVSGKESKEVFLSDGKTEIVEEKRNFRCFMDEKDGIIFRTGTFRRYTLFFEMGTCLFFGDIAKRFLRFPLQAWFVETVRIHGRIPDPDCSGFISRDVCDRQTCRL